MNDLTAPPSQVRPEAGGSSDRAAVTILYGSQTGNGKALALSWQAEAAARGVPARAVNMAEYKTAQFKRERLLLIIVSTHGEGEPPDDAKAFCDFLETGRARPAAPAAFATLALGDSSYEFFCRTGREIDRRLAALGMRRLLDLQECDVDYEDDAARWREQTIAAAAAELPAAAAAEIIPLPARLARTLPRYSRANPFLAAVMQNIRLNDGGERDTRHIELSMEESELAFAPGDSIGVLAENPPRLVNEIVDLLGGDERIEIKGETAPMSEWLCCGLEITLVTPPVFARLAETLGIKDKPKNPRAYLAGLTLADILRAAPPARGKGKDVLRALRKMPPRLYSLASSPQAREGEAHLLVAAHRFAVGAAGINLYAGLCSKYLANRAQNDEVRVYVHQNENFHLPQDDRAAMIMVGAGAGVAPFRAFVEEREYRGATGENWLFFGERRAARDFYYQTEWQGFLRRGALARMDAAFSRDGGEAKYVQHRMRQRAAELYRWLDGGAYFYVCGDESRMAKDVERALLSVIAAEGGKSEDGARAYLEAMRREGRYRRDVY